MLNVIYKSATEPSKKKAYLDGQNEVTEKDKILAHKAVEHPTVAGEIEKKVHDTQEDRLDEVVHGTARVLLSTKSLFPWDLFPDELIIDENKISFIFNNLIEKRVHSVFIKDLSDVIV